MKQLKSWWKGPLVAPYNESLHVTFLNLLTAKGGQMPLHVHHSLYSLRVSWSWTIGGSPSEGPCPYVQVLNAYAGFGPTY